MSTHARAVLTQLIRPYSCDQFFDDYVGRQPLALTGSNDLARASILGANPRTSILAAYETHAPRLTCHALAPKVKPPVARKVAGTDAFHQLIREYHHSGFTVRIPDVTGFSPELRRITRALEIVLETPVDAVIFWSAAGADAPVHHDDIDVLAIQLSGRKRWYVTDNPPTLPNQWKGAGEAPPSLGPHRAIDVAPGDLLYMPRGTAHTVQSTTESIHVSIGFVPVTLREAILATLDHLSDLDRPLRTGVTPRADDLSRGNAAAHVARQVRAGLQKLVAATRHDEFVRQAMTRRRARMVADLPKLPPADVSGSLSLDSTVRHSPLAMAHVQRTPHVLDVSIPGEQIFLHLGAEESLDYILSTAEFRVADIPGDIADDVRLALVQRLVASGFLEPLEPLGSPLPAYRRRGAAAR